MSRALIKTVSFVSARFCPKVGRLAYSDQPTTKAKKDTVKAAVLKELGAPLVIEEIKLKKPNKDQVNYIQYAIRLTLIT